MRVVATLAIGLLLGLATDAAAVVLCQKKRAVLARDGCRPGETPLSLVGLGASGAPGAAGAQGPAGRAPLHLVDAVGSEVGPLVRVEFYLPQIYDQDAPLDLALLRQPPVSDGALLGVNVAGNPIGMLFYAYADCIGTPLVRRTGLMPVLQVIGDTVFGPAGTSGATTVASVEVNDPSQGCVATTPRGGCCRSQMGTGGFENAAALTTLPALGIVPPLHAVAE